MYCWAMKSSIGIVDSSSHRNPGYGTGNPLPLCPRPRRLVSPNIPEFLMTPAASCARHSHSNSDEGCKIFNLLLAEKTAEGSEGGRCSGCSPACYAGSPPGRTGNPLVRDVQFVSRQAEMFPPYATRTKLSDKFGFGGGGTTSPA